MPRGTDKTTGEITITYYDPGTDEPREACPDCRGDCETWVIDGNPCGGEPAEAPAEFGWRAKMEEALGG